MDEIYSELSSMLDELEYLDEIKEYNKEKFLENPDKKRSAGYSLIQLSNSLAQISEDLLKHKNIEIPTTPSGEPSMNGCIRKLGKETNIIEESLSEELLDRTSFRGGASHVSVSDVEYKQIYEELQNLDTYRKFIRKVKEEIK